jgi:hypothetical protein
MQRAILPSIGFYRPGRYRFVDFFGSMLTLLIYPVSIALLRVRSIFSSPETIADPLKFRSAV